MINIIPKDQWHHYRDPKGISYPKLVTDTNCQLLMAGLMDDQEAVNRINEAIGLVNEKKYPQAWELIKDIPEDSFIWSQAGPATIKAVCMWKYRDDLPTALHMFEKILEVEPDDLGARQNADFIISEMKLKDFRHACELHQAGKLEKAHEAYYAIDLDDPINPDVRFHVANNCGNVLQQLGQVDEALQMFDVAITIQPLCAEANYNRGVIMKDRCEWDEALRSFEAALRSKPDPSFSPPVILGKLDSMCHLMMLDELLEYSEEVIDEDLLENDYHPFYYRGFAKCELEQYEDAIADLELAFSIGGILGEEYRNMENATSKSYAMYGQEIMEEDPQGAIDYFNSAMDYKPSNERQRIILYRKAVMFITLGQITDAIEELLVVVRKFPGHLLAREALGQLYLDLETYPSAIEHLLVALDDAEPDQANTMYNMGLAYYKINELYDARETFERVLNLDPDHEMAHKAIAAMDQLLAMKKVHNPDAYRFPDRPFVSGPFDGEKDGYTWVSDGDKGEGYYKNFLPGVFADERPGYVHLPRGLLGEGYYKLGEEPYFLPGAKVGETEGYTYQ